MTGELAIHPEPVRQSEWKVRPCLENYVHEPIQKKEKEKKERVLCLPVCVCGGVSDVYRFYHR